MRKKLLFTLSAAAMICSMSVIGVSAATIDQDSNPKSADTDISVEISPSYAVTIPEDTEIVFGDTKTDFDSVELSQAQLEVGKSVKVSVEAGALANTDDETKTIPYTVMAGDAEFTGAEYTAEGQSTDLTLAVTRDAWDSAYAGTYEGTVTFTISYENVTTP